MYATDRHRQALVTLKICKQLRFGSPRRNPFSTLRHPCLGFDPYFGNQWVRSTNQPLC